MEQVFVFNGGNAEYARTVRRPTPSKACLSSAVTSLRVPELDDGATRMRDLCVRARACNATTAAKLMVLIQSPRAPIGGPALWASRARFVDRLDEWGLSIGLIEPCD